MYHYTYIITSLTSVKVRPPPVNVAVVIANDDLDLITHLITISHANYDKRQSYRCCNVGKIQRRHKG